MIRTVHLVALFATVACTPTTPTGTSGVQGDPTLRLLLHDAPADADEVWVDVGDVTVHQVDAGWLTVSTGIGPVDLLALQDGVVAELGIASLDPGLYDQIRLEVLDAWVVDGGQAAPLDVPSGATTGVKIHHEFTLSDCGTTTISLDWDVGAHLTHNDGRGWMLRPTLAVDGETSECSGAGHIAIAAGDPGELHLYDRTTGAATLLYDGYTLQASGIVATPDGDLYVSDRNDPLTTGYALKRLDLDTGSVSTLATNGLMNWVQGLELEATGEVVMVSSYPFSAVVRVDPDTGVQSEVTSHGHLFAPHDLAVEASGDLLVVEADLGGPLNGGPGAVVRVDPVSGSQTLLASGGLLAHPIGIDVEPDGNIVVVDLDLDRLVRIDPGTGAQSLVSQGGYMDLPTKVKVDAQGAIFVSSYNQTLIEIDPTTGVQSLISASARGGFMELLP